MEDIIELRAKAKLLEPVLRIGKNGLSEGTIEEIKRVLKKRGMIKIKLLKAFMIGNDKKELAKEITEKTDSLIIDQIGGIVVIQKKVH